MTIASYLKPQLEPYYDIYAASYVKQVRPYAQQLDQKVITPATELVKHNYQTHAAVRIQDAKAFVQQQWEKTFLPQAQSAQKKAQEMYAGSIAPHVEKASSMVEPYYGLVKGSALNVHRKHILPALEGSKPYLGSVYGASRAFLIDTGIPYAKWIWSSMVIFVDGTLWPRVRALYGDNVKPQLDMISDRIAKYQEGRKLKASMEKVESSISAGSGTISQLEVTATPEIISETPTPPEESAPAKTKATGEEHIAAARAQVATDLHVWQDKFAKAADKGSEDLHERVREITEGLVKSEVDGEGQGLVTALRKTIENEMISFKSKIIKVVSTLSSESSSPDVEIAEKDIQDDIRQRANSIRERASAVRQWHTKFKATVTKRAEAAADLTLDVLDGIRDLGLQEIGMRWAWMDGVTYKDWAKYHELKKQFDNWRNEVREVATKHETLEEAEKAGNAILDDAMDTAKDAAIELVRLRDVGKWKINARDASDNFDSRAMPAAAASAGTKIADSVNVASESLVANGQIAMDSIVSRLGEAAAEASNTASSAVMGTTQDCMESIALIATEAAAEAASSASSAVAGTSQGELESIVSKATQSAASMMHDASAAVFGDSSSGVFADAASSASSVAASASSSVFVGAMAQQVSSSTPIFDDVIDEGDEMAFSEKVRSVVNDAGDRYAEVTGAVSEALLGTTQGTMESVSSVASEKYSSALAAASSVLYGTTQGTGESITSVASERYSQAVLA